MPLYEILRSLYAFSQDIACTSLSTDSISLAGTTLTAPFSYLNSLYAGQAAPGEYLILDGSGNLGGINSLGCVTLSCTTLHIGGQSVVASAVEIARLAGVVPGSASSGKFLCVDSNYQVSGIGILGCVSVATQTLYIGGYQVTPSAAQLNRCNISVAEGTAQASKVVTTSSANSVIGLNDVRCVSLEVNGVSVSAAAGSVTCGGSMVMTGLTVNGVVTANTFTGAYRNSGLMVSENYTLTSTRSIIIVDTATAGSAVTIHLPVVDSLNLEMVYYIKRLGGYSVYLDPDVNVKLEGATASLIMNAEWQSYTIYCIGQRGDGFTHYYVISKY